jgi:hypothetical protein
VVSIYTHIIGIEIPGGHPYNYIPWNFSIQYMNPGYPVGNNIPVNPNYNK